MADMGITEIAALTLAGASTAMTVAGTIAQGKAQDNMEHYKAAQGQQAAGQARAVSQRAADEERRKAGFAISKTQAIASANGADLQSGGVVDAESNIAGQGEFNALTQMYNGEEKARSYEQGAATDIYQGKLAQSAAKTKALSTIAQSGSSMLDKYGNSFDSGSGDEESDLPYGGKFFNTNAAADSSLPWSTSYNG